MLDKGEIDSATGGRTQVGRERMGTRKIRLIVANTGARIPEEKKKEIFERFYRSEDSRGSEAGYGLGLAIAKSRVEAHRGKIYGESYGGEKRLYVELKTTDRKGKQNK